MKDKIFIFFGVSPIAGPFAAAPFLVIGYVAKFIGLTIIYKICGICFYIILSYMILGGLVMMLSLAFDSIAERIKKRHEKE